MPRPRPSRALLLLLLVPIALVAIVALWLHDGDDDSVSGPGRLASDAESGLAAALPPAGKDSSAQPLSASTFDATDEPESFANGRDAETAHLGDVRGRLVDAGGHPVAGEPVFLVRDRDPWRRGVPTRDDESATE